jgi:hypothetical protein
LLEPTPRSATTEVDVVIIDHVEAGDHAIGTLQRRLRTARPNTLLMNQWPFDGLRACKPTVIADGRDRANCGTQALIAAITVSAIRGRPENPRR